MEREGASTDSLYVPCGKLSMISDIRVSAPVDLQEPSDTMVPLSGHGSPNCVPTASLRLHPGPHPGSNVRPRDDLR
jgi:hypothetical protein